MKMSEYYFSRIKKTNMKTYLLRMKTNNNFYRMRETERKRKGEMQ